MKFSFHGNYGWQLPSYRKLLLHEINTNLSCVKIFVNINKIISTPLNLIKYSVNIHDLSFS